jgi:pimeloyl-ACP methyl ester carboxylesterase
MKPALLGRILISPLLSWLCLACAGPDEGAESNPDEPAALRLEAAAAEVPIVIETRKLNGLSFQVRTAGPRRGELVILLHGFPENSYEWRYQIRALAAAGYRVLAPDLRGYCPGARPEAVDQYGLLSFVGDVLALADSERAFRFHLVGHDVGALVAWGTAQISGVRLRSLTALSVPHPAAFAEALKDPSSCQSKASAWYADVMPPGAATAALSDPNSLLRTVWASLPADAASEYERALGTPAALDGALNTWRANFVDGQPQGAFPIPVFVPTLFIWGDKDPYNCGDTEPVTRSMTWARYRFEPLAGLGHFLPEEAPELITRLLLGHLARPSL